MVRRNKQSTRAGTKQRNASLARRVDSPARVMDSPPRVKAARVVDSPPRADSPSHVGAERIVDSPPRVIASPTRRKTARVVDSPPRVVDSPPRRKAGRVVDSPPRAVDSPPHGGRSPALRSLIISLARPSFRKSFSADPLGALARSGIDVSHVPAAQLEVLAGLPHEELALVVSVLLRLRDGHPDRILSV
jgi:hypothetical protein